MTLARVLDGRYVLGARLGSGGMAEVYSARDTVLDREVAIKLFHQAGSLPDGELRRSAEVRLLAGFSHPGLVTLFDAGRDTSNPADPFAYLVMELVDGTTLAQLITAGPLAEGRVAALAEQIADALAYVHERGVVHRDIKPANVLVDHAGTRAKLADFGVARLVDSTRLTAHGTTLGTPNYLSPEQATGGTVGPESDIYSLGLVLLETLTGERAFPGSGVEAAVARVHRAPEVPNWLPAPWISLLSEMTASEPTDRPSAAAVSARLAGLRSGTAPTAVLTTPSRSQPPRRTWLAVGAAAVVAAVVALVVVLASSGGGNGVPTPTPSYPAVAGALGQHLRALQDAVPSQFHAAVLAVTEAAAHGEVKPGQAALARLTAALNGAHSAGELGDSQFAAAGAAIAAVSADLARMASAASSASAAAASASSASAAAASASSASAAAARSSSAAAPAPPAGKPQPPKPPKPGKHKGHGRGPGHGADD